MLIRKNTKAFKTILEIVTTCSRRADREKFIRLYITKAGHTIDDRINVEGIPGEAGLFYEMNYDTVLSNLNSPNHQLHVSDEVPGIYFFHSTSNKTWDETPFEFDAAINKEFSALPELPAVRKREKAREITLPVPKSSAPSTEKKKVDAARTVKIPEREHKQPEYRLKHKIQFTDLDKIVTARITKRDILDYYNTIAEYILPHLKDRNGWARLYSRKDLTEMTFESLFQNSDVEVPGWIQTTRVSRGKEYKRMLRCNDREHLLFYIEKGCLEFTPCLARMKHADFPDYIVIVIESPKSELEDVVDVALAARDILTALKLPAFVKTDGLSGLHLYIPLDSKSRFDTGKKAAENICRLIKLKIPDLITLNGSEDHVYGKVSVNYALNEPGQSVVAPYSFVIETAAIATPLEWGEVKHGLNSEDFNPEAILKRLKHNGDPFESLFKKKVNADALLERLQENYSFLL